METPVVPRPKIIIPANAAVAKKQPARAPLEPINPIPAHIMDHYYGPPGPRPPPKVIKFQTQANFNARFKADFDANFLKAKGKSWAQASKEEKEDFVVAKVLALYTKLNALTPKEKKARVNPFTQSDFTLTQEELYALPHNWFKGCYLGLKMGYGASLGVGLTDLEVAIDSDGETALAYSKSKTPPHKSFIFRTWVGASRKARRNRKNRKTKRNN